MVIVLEIECSKNGALRVNPLKEPVRALERMSEGILESGCLASRASEKRMTECMKNEPYDWAHMQVFRCSQRSEETISFAVDVLLSTLLKFQR